MCTYQHNDQWTTQKYGLGCSCTRQIIRRCCWESIGVGAYWWMKSKFWLDKIVFLQIQLQDRVFDGGKHKPDVLRVCNIQQAPIHESEASSTGQASPVWGAIHETAYGRCAYASCTTLLRRSYDTTFFVNKGTNSSLPMTELRNVTCDMGSCIMYTVLPAIWEKWTRPP